MSKVAALFVERGGAYWNLPDVDAWDRERDARLYAGPWPVVAHPPCERWSRLAALVESMGGKRRGDDDGCFGSALTSVRKWGGVLEHPAWSEAWPTFGLPQPRAQGWQRGLDGSWVASVEQGLYGHPAPKATWLYAVGIDPVPLLGGRAECEFVVGKSRTNRANKREIPKSQRAATPILFRDLLLSIARTAADRSEAA